MFDAKTRATDGFALTRRGFLEFGLLGASGLLRGALPSVPAPAPGARAKAIIQVWLWGGPSHLDTFDPKPEAGRDFTGPYAKALPTKVDGLQLGPLLPLLAQQAERFALLRGMTHGSNAHETAAYLVQAGRKPGNGLVFPGLGAVVSFFRGQASGPLPPYVTLTRPQGRFSEAGFLGPRYRPFATGGDPAKEPFAVEGVVSEKLTEARQRERRELLERLDGYGRGGSEPLVAALDEARREAYAMILGDTGKVFSLAQEKAETRDRYGRSTFGQSCLMARRLVERGVPFVTLNHGGWDTHKQHFEAMGRKLPELDKGLSALLEDLAQRGLLESTIVWVGGEFGRTPQVQWEAPWHGGRGHYGKAFSTLVAGGGFQGGRVVGRTSERGETVVDRPIYPWDLLGSFYALMGIDPQARLLTPEGERPFVSPFAAGEIPPGETGGLLKELMA